MEDCYTSTPNSNLTPPFATVLKVLKTKDGLPFEEDDVVNFYKNHFESRGWKNITREGSKRSLEFQINVYDQSGNLSIWLAPNDGMLTIYMHQWRISRLSQDSQTLFEKTESDLNASAAKNEYKISQSHGPNWWIEYYENEYLVTAKLFSLSSKRVYPKGPGLGNCMSSKGRISAALLAYRPDRLR